MKTFFRTIHLYLSLAAGLVILITCLTGAVLVFEEELQEAFNSERYFTGIKGERLSLDLLAQNVKKEVPGANISSVKVYADPARTIEISYSEKGDGNTPGKQAEEKHKVSAEKGKEGKRGKGATRKTAFVNPYTGEVIALYSYRETFFYKVFALHRWLLGSNTGIGKYIVGVSTFIFLFILMTGIILWWPKTRRILFQRLKIKSDAGWKRFNHDLHIVSGFYTAIFLFIFAFTGLSWSFQWFNKGIYWVTNSKMEQTEPPVSTIQGHRKPINFDEAFTSVTKQIKDARFYNIMAPKDSSAVYTVTVLAAGRKSMETDSYYVDQYSRQIIGTLKFKDKNLGQRVRATVKPVHVGSVFGTPSKILAFIVCLLGVTFPITGVIMWINRLKKSGRKKNKAPSLEYQQLK